MTLRLSDPSPHLWGENFPFWYLALARIASLFLMATGAYYWADLLGILGVSGLERGPWYEAGIRVSLSCSFLIASVGVWQLSFWGIVLWVLSSLAQSGALIWVEIFMPMQGLLSLLHILALILLLGTSGWLYVKASRNKQEA